jgi:murein DD-endopeptidase MepM/ murein hydrolase activator NlpD
MDDMKRISVLAFAILLLAACAPQVTSLPASTAAPADTVIPTRSPATDQPVSSPIPPIETPIPCDASSKDYCIQEGHFILQRPIHSPDNDSVERTYPFGSTDEGAREAHHGVEFINATGTPVYAAADGTILFAGPDDEAVFSPWKKFYGNLIVIRHADGLYSLYAHLSKIDVQAGQKIKAGGRIGEVGKTGGAIGSHLHFEVRKGDLEDYFSALNPELWLVPREGEGVLSISVVNAQGEYRNADITIQSEGRSYFVNTYEEKFPFTEENAALGELTPGRYRITFYSAGLFYERWVEVQAGKLTQVLFVVK